MLALRLFDPRQPGAFRLWLALLVVADHVFGIHLGLVAVYLFFMLSGFWIHRIWDLRYRSGTNPYLAFVLSRFGRLVPVMVCAMALAIAVQWAASGIRPSEAFGKLSGTELLSHVLILGYGQTPGPLVLPPAWTLDLEIQFYLLAPALYAVLKRIGTAPFLALGAGVAVLSPGAGLGIPVLPYLVLFMAGMAASANDWRPSAISQKLSTSLALIIIGIIVFGDYAQMLFDPGDAPATSRLNWLLAIVLAPVALATVWRRGGDSRDSVLGDMSYIVYLLHWPVLVWTSALAANMAPGAALPLFFSMLVAVSLVVWRYVDHPLNSLRTGAVTRWAHRGTVRDDAPAHAGHPT